MKKLGLTVLLTGALAVAAFSMADAQGQRRGPGGFGPGMGRGFIALQNLDLTDAQRDQVRAILQEERSGEAPAHRKLHQQLRAELLADTPDDQKIALLRDQITRAQGEALTHQIDVQRKIAQVLTAEQRAKAREALAKARDNRDGRGRRGLR
jgi:Spy/CpxP family protein refolding chaperone